MPRDQGLIILGLLQTFSSQTGTLFLFHLFRRLLPPPALPLPLPPPTGFLLTGEVEWLDALAAG